MGASDGTAHDDEHAGEKATCKKAAREKAELEQASMIAISTAMQEAISALVAAWRPVTTGTPNGAHKLLGPSSNC